MRNENINYRKRTQKDYTMQFKLSVVNELETTSIGLCAIARKYGIQSESTVKRWLEKYGTFDTEYVKSGKMEKSKDQQILELEARIKELERKNARLEYQVEMADHKSALFDMIIDMAEKEYKIDIRKNSQPGQSGTTKSKKD